MRARLWAWALRKLQARCEHPPQHVSADILEGDTQPFQLAWCRICGAHRRDYDDSAIPPKRGTWRAPRPDWCFAPAVNIRRAIREWFQAEADL